MIDKDDVLFIKEVIRKVAREEAEKVARSCVRAFKAVLVEKPNDSHPGKAVVRLCGEETELTLPLVTDLIDLQSLNTGDIVHVWTFYDTLENGFVFTSWNGIFDNAN